MQALSLLTDPNAWAARVTLTALEIVLGIDNLVFISRVGQSRGAFIAAHPTTKVLALAFLVLIGIALVADGFEFHIPRGYIYFAIAFAAAVEAFKVMARRNRQRRPRS
jgi:predicted tellurium resistance membrane protein TerC